MKNISLAEAVLLEYIDNVLNYSEYIDSSEFLSEKDRKDAIKKIKKLRKELKSGTLHHEDLEGFCDRYSFEFDILLSNGGLGLDQKKFELLTSDFQYHD